VYVKTIGIPLLARGREKKIERRLFKIKSSIFLLFLQLKEKINGG